MATRQRDDFVIMMRPPAKGLLGRTLPAACCAILGPGLAPEGIPFTSLDVALTRGREIAGASRVSLWDDTAKAWTQ